MEIDQQPKVSIVLPTYNGARYLTQAIDSCLNQTHRNIELIIVDDCSTDETPDIVHSFNDPRIHYVRNKTNQRLPRSLNIGFALTTGEYLTWTSDDNQFLSTAIEEMLNSLKSHPDCEFVYADMLVRNLETGEEKFRILSHDDLEVNNNIGACYLYTRRVHTQVGNYDPRFEWLEDYDYWIRVNKKFKIFHYQKILYIYGDHGRSLTSAHYYSIALLRSFLLYHHGYRNSNELKNEIRVLWRRLLHFKKGHAEIRWTWKLLARKIFGVSLSLGLLFLLLCTVLLGEKLRNRITTPLEYWKLRLHINHLKVSRNRKNILCFVPKMVFGGSEKVMETIVRELQKNGYDFHLVCNKKENSQWCARFQSAFKNVILLPEEADEKAYHHYVPQIVEKLCIKLILATNSWAFYRYLPKIKEQFPHVKIVDILHLERVGGAHEKFIPVSPYLHERVCISHHLKKYMLEQYEKIFGDCQLGERINVIYNGTDEDYFQNQKMNSNGLRKRFNIPADAKIVTFIGRFSKEKKPLLFLEIAKKILGDVKKADLRFVMAGDGPYYSAVKKRIQERRLEKIFTLTGVLGDVRELLSETHILVLISDHEGIPLAIQEALAMGVPVISTNVGAVREIIKPGVNGYLIDCNDNLACSVSKKSVELLQNGKLQNAIAKQAPASIIPTFTVREMTSKYKEIFERLLA